MPGNGMDPNQLNSTVQSVRFMALEREKKMKPDKKHDLKYLILSIALAALICGALLTIHWWGNWLLSLLELL